MRMGQEPLDLFLKINEGNLAETPIAPVYTFELSVPWDYFILQDSPLTDSIARIREIIMCVDDSLRN